MWTSLNSIAGVAVVYKAEILAVTGQDTVIILFMFCFPYSF